MNTRSWSSAVLVLVIGAGLPAAAAARDVLENHLGMRFVRIPAGEFVMGTEDVEEARMEIPEPEPGQITDETPAHRVVVSGDFYLGETEVTQGVWLKVMENRPGPAAFWAGEEWADRPVAAASWNMAQRFVEELNRMDPDRRYRLPTEAEWEYAARAGTTGLRPVAADDVGDYAWFIHNSGDRPHPVATRKPNGFGLYDMLGNVWEWVADWYAPDTYAPGVRRDPTGPSTGQSRVRRGGSYHCPLHLVRPGYRGANAPHMRFTVLGLRVVAEPRRDGAATG